MEPRVYTVIETDESEAQNTRFEWYGGKTVNVVQETFPSWQNAGSVWEQVDTFNFMEQPTQAQVAKACEAYFS